MASRISVKVAATPNLSAGLKQLVGLSSTKVCNGKYEAQIETLDDTCLDEICDRLSHLSTNQLDHSKEKLHRHNLRHRLHNSDVVQLTDADSGDLMALAAFEPSTLCRSTKPLLHSTWLAAAQKYTDKGLHKDVEGLSQIYGRSAGYLGSLVQTPQRTSGQDVLTDNMGYIPHGTPLENHTYCNDALQFNKYQVDDTSHKNMIGNMETAMEDLVTDDVRLTFRYLGEPGYEPRVLKLESGLTVRIRTAINGNEVLETERLWRDAAQKGEGIALDEFDEYGFLNRHLFRKSQVTIVEDTKGYVIGAALLGRSMLSKAVPPVLAHCYVTTHPEYRGLGLATALQTYALDNFKKEGYKGCVTDTFSNNHTTLDLLSKNGFHITGTVPMSGYISNHGLMSSNILYKNLS